MKTKESLMVYSIFLSIDGEVNYYGQGGFATFIRLAGCNLECRWCDTKYAQKYRNGEEMFLDEIMVQVERLGCKKITITGGEPLCQPNALSSLTKALWHSRYKMTIETNGSLEPTGLYGASSFVVDYKLPSSGMMEEMLPDQSFLNLTSNDYIKFVICGKMDYHFAKAKINYWNSRGGTKAKIAFSPGNASSIPLGQLIERMKKDKLFDVMLNLQLHKLVDFGEHK